MGILKHIRSKSKIKNNFTGSDADQGQNKGYATPAAWTPNPTAKYSRELLQRIFSFVCPHTYDEELVSLEESMSDWYGCLLCGYRDLGMLSGHRFNACNTHSGGSKLRCSGSTMGRCSAKPAVRSS